MESARALGGPDRLILVRPIVPQRLSPVIVGVRLAVGATILAPAGLTFPRLRPSPPTADWGRRLAPGRPSAC